jgi:dTDP-4-dehydrorhamnose 3,5-epimerase
MNISDQIIDVNSIRIEKEPYVSSTRIKGVYIIKRPQFSDLRGSFQELYRIPDINKIFARTKVMQSQISISKSNVLRGVHAEPRDKIITPITGRMSAVIVDLRKSSPTFKKWARFDFNNNSSNGIFTTLFVPSGCGNSVCVYKEKDDKGDGNVIYYYSYSSIYNPKWAGSGVRYNDPQLKIKWPIKTPILSERDKNLPLLEDFLRNYR